MRAVDNICQVDIVNNLVDDGRESSSFFAGLVSIGWHA